MKLHTFKELMELVSNAKRAEELIEFYGERDLIDDQSYMLNFACIQFAVDSAYLLLDHAVNEAGKIKINED